MDSPDAGFPLIIGGLLEARLAEGMLRTNDPLGTRWNLYGIFITF
jgi:hypothetical protein